LPEISLILRNIERDTIKINIGLHVKYRYSCPISMKSELSRRIVKKKNTQMSDFQDSPSSEGRVVPCERADGWMEPDMSKPIVTFRNYANTPLQIVTEQYDMCLCVLRKRKLV
jgi:hypothetical protein